MRNMFIMCFLIVFIVGCERNPTEMSIGDIGEKEIDKTAQEIEQEAEDISGGLEKKSIESSIERSAGLKEADEEIAIKAQVLSESEGEKETRVVASQDRVRKEDIISEGRWFFAVYHLQTGYIDYYDGYGNFLGQRKK